MDFLDFEYDGIRLSDLGFMVCTFSESGLETRPASGAAAFSTVPLFFGGRHALTGVSYPECLTASFSICKLPGNSREDSYVTEQERRTLVRWLARKEFLPFRPIRENESAVYYEGSFQMNEYVFNGRVIGYELTLITNRPYGFSQPVTYSFAIQEADGTYTIDDTSDEIGYLYADTKIICDADGALSITNSQEPDRQTDILGCRKGETITLKHPIIETSLISHKIQNDFDYNFPRIANSASSRENRFRFSLPCRVTMTYSPIRKAGV
jgi:hypothetical protein